MKWEYKTVEVKTTWLKSGKFDKNSFDQLLNGFGQQGWELVSSFEGGSSRRVAGILQKDSSRHVVAILKRPIE